MSEKKSPPNLDAGRGRRVALARSNSILEKLKLIDDRRAQDERGALAVLRSFSAGGKAAGRRDLTDQLVVAMATRMHQILAEFEPVFDAKGITKTALCSKAFAGAVDSKELYRLTLPPDSDPKVRGLRKSGVNYRALLKAIADLTGSSFRDLAYRLLEATPLNPVGQSMAEFAQIDLVATALEDLVRRLSIEYHWHDTYERTAKLKHDAVAVGDRCCWPLYDLEPEWEDLSTPEGQAAYADQIRVALDPEQAYGRHHTSSTIDTGAPHSQAVAHFDQGRRQGDSFFYVPHAPIGQLILWDLPDARSDMVAYHVARERLLAAARTNTAFKSVPADEWDTERQCPVGQTDGGPAQHHFWLVAYPDSLWQGVIPCLFEPGEEGGSFLAPLNARTLAWLSEAVWSDGSLHLPLLDRLQALLTVDGTDGSSALERELRRTATWLEHNPILSRHEATQAGRARLVDTMTGRESRTNTIKRG